jgi:hypothetical protein
MYVLRIQVVLILDLSKVVRAACNPWRLELCLRLLLAPGPNSGVKVVSHCSQLYEEPISGEA